jgi:hypothetical protein
MIFQVGFNMPSVDFSAILGTLAIGLTVGIGVIAIIVFIYLLNYFFSYNISVTLLEQSSNGLNKLDDRGRVDKKKGEWKSLKYGKKFDFFIPMSDYYVQSGRKKTLFGYVVNDSVSWLKVSPNPGFIPASANLKSLTIQRLRRNWEATQNKIGFWEKYGGHVMLGIIAVVLLVSIILIMNKVEMAIKMGQNIGSAAVAAKTQTI